MEESEREGIIESYLERVAEQGEILEENINLD